MDRDEAYAAAEELKNTGKIEEAVTALDAVVAKTRFCLGLFGLGGVVYSIGAT